jgi:hypothetical protein
VAPASRPQFALVVINDPSNGAYYGGAVSAPVFSQIMGDVLRLENVMPDGAAGSENLIVMHNGDAARRRCNSGLKGRIALHFRPFSDTGVVMSYSCPLCHAPLSRRDNSYICPQRHQFDLAKEGYVNLLPVQFKRSRDPGDSAEMMQAGVSRCGPLSAAA